MKTCRGIALGLVLTALSTAIGARAGSWIPNGIVPTRATTASILGAYRASVGIMPPRERVETYHLTAPNGVSLNSTALIRGRDFRIDTTIDGETYASGRAGFHRWRRTPAGVVRIIESDVQGDALDRWPHAVLGFSAAFCSAIGETRAVTPDWILRCQSPGGLPHWYYVDESTGRIMREITRDGAKVVTYTFRNFRTIDGTTRAFAWHVSGVGGDADVHLVHVVARSVGVRAVSIPTSAPTTFVVPAGLSSRLPVRFAASGRMTVPVELNGHTLTFVIDTGTTQILMDIGAAVRSGLHPVLGHAIAPKLRIGDAFANDVPIETTNIFGGRIAGLLGNEFFIGHIVHINFQSGTLDFLPRSTFTPPSNSIEMAANYAEGMPLIAARVGKFRGDRFAIDTGSTAIMLGSAFAQRAAAALIPLRVAGKSGFLEGRVIV
ncbi:MAG TPA: retropepsin-like aspartic protease, partial [Candidatus Dormibacteraeota bacterium]|nr:retropepsin-like aspartic protease [Candidatus Dormibacteraeota bacterium]